MAEVIVVGAGIVGNACAVALANQGRKILLIERDWSEPNRIVGELLQPGGIQALELLGIERMDGVTNNGYAIFNGTGAVVLKYPKDKMPNSGLSFHHGRLIMNLRAVSKSHTNITTIGASVTTLLKSKNNPDHIIGVTYRENDTLKDAYAPLTIVADGCFSKFRKQIITKQPTVKSHFVGLVLKDCDLPYPNFGHVVLASPSPILLYQISTHDTRILVDIPGNLPSIGNGDMKKYLLDRVCPQLPESCQNSFIKAVESDTVRSMPNSWLPPSRNDSLGLLMLGDAANMRHPLTGGGMTVGLWDCVHVGNLLHPNLIPDLSDTKEVQKQLQKLHWRRKPLASVINILAQALYALFSAGNDVNMLELRQACFGYLGLGGRCSSTPVGLLAGYEMLLIISVIPSPITLVGHFFAVALYGIFKILCRDPIMFPIMIFRCVMVFWTACVVILPIILSELVQ